MIQPAYSRRPLAAALLALALLVLPGTAQEPAQQEREHVVRRGDTLWDLAGHYLGNPFLWPMIFEANRSVVENPHWIYPGERLRIPGVPGAAAAQPAAQPLGEPVAAGQQPGAPPAGAAAAARPAAAAVTLDLRRPVIQAAEYYSTPWLEPAVGARTVGRVVRLADEPGTALDRIAPELHPHYRILIGELQNGGAQAGDSLLLVRLGRLVTGYGLVVEPLALVRVDSVAGGLLSGRVVAQFETAKVGDEVMRLERLPEIPLGRAEPVANGPEGQLLDFLTAQQIYGTGDRGFVAFGDAALRVGDQLAIYNSGGPRAAAPNEVVPPTEIARALVVRVAGRSATVRLTGVFDTSVRAGLRARLVARLP